MTQRAKRRALKRKQEQQQQKRSPVVATQKTFVLSGDLAMTVGLEELRRSVAAIQDFRLNPRVCEEALASFSRALTSLPHRYNPAHQDFRDFIALQEGRSLMPVQLWEILNGEEAIVSSSISPAGWRFPIPVSRFTISRSSDDEITIECTMILNSRLWTVEGSRLCRRDREECQIYGTVITGRGFFDSDSFEIDFRVITQRINTHLDAMHNVDAMQFEVASISDYFAAGRSRLEQMDYRFLREFQANSSMMSTARSDRFDRRPKACQGCSYYHEPAYRGDTLICAVHPEGCQSESCPDWRSY